MWLIPATASMAADGPAMIDDCDSDLAEHQWRVQWAGGRKGGSSRNAYLARHTVMDGRKCTQLIHRVILSRKLGRPLARTEFVDHVNGNGLDNRRRNLRLATRSQNGANRWRVSGTSRYLGVYRDRENGLWRVTVTVDGRTLSIGRYRSEIEAAAAYDAAASRYHGEFARLNLARSER